MALRHGHSTNARGLRSKHFIFDVSAESSQSSVTTSSRMLATAAVTSGLDSIINIARARRLGLFGHVPRFIVMFQRPTFSPYAVLLEMDILLTLLGGAQVDDLEPPGLITSLLTLTCLWPIHFLWHKIVRSGAQSLRSQRPWVPDWLTGPFYAFIGNVSKGWPCPQPKGGTPVAKTYSSQPLCAPEMWSSRKFKKVQKMTKFVKVRKRSNVKLRQSKSLYEDHLWHHCGVQRNVLQISLS